MSDPRSPQAARNGMRLEERAEMRARHVPTKAEWPECAGCEQDWPCDASRLLDASCGHPAEYQRFIPTDREPAGETVCGVCSAALAAATPEPPQDDVMPNECPTCGGVCADSWHRWAPGGSV